MVFSLLLPFLNPRGFRPSSFLLLFFVVGILLEFHARGAAPMMSLAEKREKVIVEGIVVTPARVSQDRARFEVRSERVWLRGYPAAIRDRLLVTVYRHGTVHYPGERIRFPARLRKFRNFNNPGCYDYEWAMRSRGLSCAALVSDGRFVVPRGKGDLGFPADLLEGARRPIRALFQERLDPDKEALFRAYVLGETQGISPELREPFNIAGLGHTLAVSGLHIGLVAWLAFALFRRLFGLSYRLMLAADIRRLAALATCVPVVAYACLAGLQVSSQRAMMMCLAYLFSMIIGRDKEALSTLALAALAVLAVEPHALFGISFQLSFAAVLGILWLAPAIQGKMPFLGKETRGYGGVQYRLWTYFAGLSVVTLSALLFLLPVTVFYFHRVSLLSLPANVTVMPILGLWIIPLGLLSAMILPFSQGVAGFCLDLGASGMDLMLAIIGFWSRFSWAELWMFTPSPLEFLIFYGLLLTIFFYRRWPWARLGLCVVMVLLVSDVLYWTYRTRFNPHLRVTYLDVGQGNSALIEFPGSQRMLIDGGGFGSDVFDVGRMVVAPFLFQRKIGQIDYLVLSHPQMDHMGGLRFIATHFQPREFWCNGDRVESQAYRELMEILDSRKVLKRLPHELRNGVEISGVKVDLLHPVPPGCAGSAEERNLNDHSLVLKLTYGGQAVLFPGDIERRGEESLVASAGPLLRSDILLAPHHGSKTSCTRPFLQQVRPQVCIVSSGSGNSFGFPHLKILKRLRECGVSVLRTDRVGAIEALITRDGMKIKTYVHESDEEVPAERPSGPRAPYPMAMAATEGASRGRP
jgi:competence protein ComEC